MKLKKLYYYFVYSVKKILFASFFLVLLFIKVFAHNVNEIDSLENLLNNFPSENIAKVDLLNQIAYKIYSVDLDKTYEFAQKAEKLADKLNYRKGRAESLRLLGIYFRYKSDFLKALDYYEKALRINEDISKSSDSLIALSGKQGISKCYNNIGIVYKTLGDYPNALELYLKALKINEETGNKQGISHCLNNIGVINDNQGNLTNAIEYYQKSMKVNEELGNKRGISLGLNNIGNVYFQLQQYEEAAIYFHKALQLYEEIDDLMGISMCLHNIGNVNFQQGNYQQALINYNKALKINNKIEEKSGVCLLYESIGEVYLKTKDFQKALNYTNKSLLIAKNLELLENQKYIYKQLADIYAGLKNYKNAFKNFVLYKKLSDSIFNEKNIKQITNLENQYKYEKEKQAIELKQQKKDAILVEEAKRQKVLRNSFILGFLLMFILVLVVLRSFLQKRNANRILAEQKQLITDSINYASKIQSAILPSKKQIDKLLPDYFILYKPRDIVSGDFYWIKKIKNQLIIAVADCTGHGVPGAFMSMLGISFLNEIVRKKEVAKPSAALEELRKQVKISLKQIPEGGNVSGNSKEYSLSNVRDGMDIALCTIDTKSLIMEYSGANNPLYLIRDNELKEIKPTNNPIGIYIREIDFENREIQLYPNDVLYLFTDGYADQFGGTKNNKFYSSRFKNLLLNNYKKPMTEQKIILEENFADWKGNNFQVDDILVVGIRIK
ncbi:MAG: tetratricopeptide repeat protein [Chlorobi bacterium]|nr:tetratricopeptide repeat protein [Chlorobiota bacterium]